MTFLRALGASLLLLHTLAAEDCGAGVGDLRESTDAKSACEACHGSLSYDNAAADGLGYTSCSGAQAEQQKSSTPASECGAGVGDLRESTDAKSACEACHGSLSYDNAAADGLGHTSCSTHSAAQPQALSAPVAGCGEGIGDLTQVEASRSACEACFGVLAFGPLGANGLGYTACVTQQDDAPVPEQQGAALLHQHKAYTAQLRILFCVLLLVVAVAIACRMTAMTSKGSRKLVEEEQEEEVKGRGAAPREKEAAEIEASPAKGKVADLYTVV